MTKDDRLLVETHREASSAVPSDITTEFYYPLEYFVTITYIQIIADQSIPKGSAFIREGGLGTNFVSAVVYANNTFFLNIKFLVRGYVH